MTPPADPRCRAADTDAAGLAARLRRDGWCILDQALPAATIAALDAELAEDFAATPFGVGGFYGETTKRFGGLLARSDHAAALVMHPLIRAAAAQVLAPWCDTIRLNVAQAIAVHPGAPAQMPHRDQDMWRGPTGEIEYLVNVIWALTPFRPDNGATLVWPGSHGRRALEADTEVAPVPAEMTPGSALMFLGSTLHGAGANRSTEIRRGVVVGYSLGWLRTYENQFLAYPPATARRFAPELAALVGYCQHRPNLGNYEGDCPSLLLRDTVPERIGARDALRPDQEEMIARFASEQSASP